MNECNVLFPINDEGKVDVKRNVYETNNQLKKSTFKYEKQGQLFLGVDKIESKEDGTITGYVGKLKGIGKQGEVKTNEMNMKTISDLQRYV